MNNLICFYLIIANIGLVAIILNKYLKHEAILKYLSIAIMTFLVEYTFFSIVLLSVNKFSVGKTIIGISIVNIILIIYQIMKKNNYILDDGSTTSLITGNIKSTIAVVGIIVLLLPFVWQKAEFIFPGQDGGVYALKSIDMLNGDTSNVKELLEYELVGENEKSKVLEFQQNQAGLYEKSKTEEKYFYDYHGLPTWPSVMALSGKILGIQNIAGILTTLFCLILIFLYYVLDELKVSKSSKLLAIIIFGFSPLTIYLAKHSLSEMFWTTMFMFAILGIINKSNAIKIIGGIALGLLGFIHVSTFMYFPLFVGILFALQIIYKRKIFGVINIIFNVFFILSLVYGCIVSKKYFLSQFTYSVGLYLGIKSELITLIVISMISMVSIGVVLLIAYNKKINLIINKLWSYIEPKLFEILKYVLIILLIYLVYQAYRLGFTDTYSEAGVSSWTFRTIYANKGLMSFLHLNIFSVMQATSYIIVPILIYKIYGMKKANKKILIFLSIFIYSLSIYTVIRIDTPINYYASRYFFIVLIPSIIILFSLLNISNKWKILILATTILVNLPFNLVQYSGQEFKENLQMVEDAVSVIDPNSIVLIDSSAHPNLYITNLRERNNNLVYPIDIKLDQSLIKDKEIYIISNGKCPQNYTEMEISQLLMKEYKTNGQISTTDGIYPLKYKQDNIKINIYKVNKEQTSYVPDDGTYSGFDGVEKNSNGENFSWTSGNSKVSMHFHDINSKIRIYYEPIIPFDKIKLEKMNFNISIDNHLIYSGELNKENISNGYFDFDMLSDMIEDTFKHTLEIQCDIWSPSEYGSGDTRQLGMPIKKIEIVK